MDLEDVHSTVVPAVMALTRAMTAKLAALRSVEEGSATPAKSSSASSWKLPTPRSSRRLTVCDVRLTEMSLNSDAASTFSSSNFDFNELAIQINAQFTDLNDKVERISTKVSHIEQSIIDQHAIINELEREISIIDNTLVKLSHVNPNSSVIPSSQHTFTYFPRIDSPEPSSQPKPRSYPRNSYPPPIAHLRLVLVHLHHALVHLHLTHILLHLALVHFALVHLHLTHIHLHVAHTLHLHLTHIHLDLDLAHLHLSLTRLSLVLILTLVLPHHTLIRFVKAQPEVSIIIMPHLLVPIHPLPLLVSCCWWWETAILNT